MAIRRVTIRPRMAGETEQEAKSRMVGQLIGWVKKRPEPDQSKSRKRLSEEELDELSKALFPPDITGV